MSRTEQSYAHSIMVGDVIVCPNGDSITVETIDRRDFGAYITFTGTQATHSYAGVTTVPNARYESFADDLVTILSK